MVVIAMNRADFRVMQFNGVTNLAITSTQITVTHAGGTYVLLLSEWIAQLIN